MTTAKQPLTLEEKLQELVQGMAKMKAYVKKLEQQIHDTEANSLHASQQSEKSATEAAQSQALASNISKQVVETLAKQNRGHMIYNHLSYSIIDKAVSNYGLTGLKERPRTGMKRES